MNFPNIFFVGGQRTAQNWQTNFLKLEVSHPQLVSLMGVISTSHPPKKTNFPSWIAIIQLRLMFWQLLDLISPSTLLMPVPLEDLTIQKYLRRVPCGLQWKLGRDLSQVVSYWAIQGMPWETGSSPHSQVEIKYTCWESLSIHVKLKTDILKHSL